MSHFPAKSIRDICLTHSCCQKQSIEKKNGYRNKLRLMQIALRELGVVSTQCLYV